jgi:hypothetical protein
MVVGDDGRTTGVVTALYRGRATGEQVEWEQILEKRRKSTTGVGTETRWNERRSYDAS